MSLGVSNVAGMYYQNYVKQQTKEAGQNDKTDFGSALSAKRAESAGQAQGTAGTGTSKTDAYLDYLKSRYGCSVLVKSVESDQRSMDALGGSTYGSNNVVIAPNILEQMANDPQKAAHYEKMIQDYYASASVCEAQLYAMGHEVHSQGLVIHPDGTAHHYVTGDLRPEVRAKIEARMKAEDEEKAKRKQRYRELSEEAAQKRREMTEAMYKRHFAEEAMKDRLFFTSQTIGTEMSPQIIASAFAAYDKSIMEVMGNSGNNII